VKPLALLLTLLFPLFATAQAPIKATTRVMPDGSTLSTVTNPDTHTREEIYAEANGKIRTKKLYQLNDQNFAKSVIHFDSQNRVRYKEVYSFDFSGRITESKLFSPEDQPLGRRVFIYEGQSPSARIVDYDASGNLLAPRPKSPPPKGGPTEVRRATPTR